MIFQNQVEGLLLSTNTCKEGLPTSSASSKNSFLVALPGCLLSSHDNYLLWLPLPAPAGWVQMSPEVNIAPLPLAHLQEGSWHSRFIPVDVMQCLRKQTGSTQQLSSRQTLSWPNGDMQSSGENFTRTVSFLYSKKITAFIFRACLSSSASGSSRKPHCKQYDKHYIITCLYAKWYKLR